ncbi:MAG TPA: hypothetical protein VHF24_06310 [Acidimicrobiales bacterium]|nr:hypothetical protein [Acidimicrobiales bacterium]
MSDNPTCEVCGEPVTAEDPGRVVAHLRAPVVTLETNFTPTMQQDVYRHDRCMG